jgi:hypothetical protein
MSDGANVEHGGVWRGVNENVKVAAFLVITMQHGAKNSGIARTVALDH